MGAGNFFSGLLSGYAGTVANQEERAYKQHIAARTFDVQTAIKAMDDAVKTGDQTAIQAASANLNRAMQGLETPFDYHRGKGKKGGKGQQGGMNPIAQAAIAGIQRSAQQPSQPMDEKIPAGPQAGQSAQSVGLPALPAPPQAAVPAAQTPPIPAPPASLESAALALPSPAEMARRQEAIKEATASSQFKFDQGQFDQVVNKLETERGQKLNPEEKGDLYLEWMKMVPANRRPDPLTKLPIDAKDAPSNAVTLDGKAVATLPPTTKVNLFRWGDGRIVAVPGTMLGVGSTSQTGIYQVPGGQSTPAFRDPKSGAIVDSGGNTLTGGTFIPTAQMPTSSQGTAFQVLADPNNPSISRVVQIPIQRTSQKIAPGSRAPALPRSPSEPRDVGIKPEPLSQGAKMTIEDLTTAQQRLNEILPILQKMPKNASTGILEQSWDKLKSEFYWKQYQAGMAVPEPYESMFSTISLMSTLMSSQYLHGMRNMIWVNRISTHMPQPTDTPAQMIGKINNINKNIPPLIQHIYSVEQPGIKRETRSSQPSQSAPAHKIGDIVTLKSGQQVRITKLLKGGKYEAVPAQ